MPEADSAIRPAFRIAIVLAVSLFLGGATSFAQGLLPDAIVSFGNSASGWTLLTALLVFWARLGWLGSGLLGAASFVLLTVGYALVSTWRGFFYDPLLFAVIGVIVGPFVGVAACWLWRRGYRAALGVALLTGIAVGEAYYGLTVVGETTSPIYWILIGVIGLALLGWALVTRIRGVGPVAVALGASAGVAVAFVLAYAQIGAI